MQLACVGPGSPLASPSRETAKKVKHKFALFNVSERRVANPWTLDYVLQCVCDMYSNKKELLGFISTQECQIPLMGVVHADITARKRVDMLSE